MWSMWSDHCLEKCLSIRNHILVSLTPRKVLHHMVSVNLVKFGPHGLFVFFFFGGGGPPCIDIHSTKKVLSSRLTLFDITREIFNQNSSFKMQCMHNFLTHIFIGYSLSLYWEITEFMKSFLSIGLWRFIAWHRTTDTKTACTQWSAWEPHWTKVPVISKHPAQQNWCFDYESSDKLQRMTTHNVCKKFQHACMPYKKLKILIKYFTRKRVRLELTFLVECIFSFFTQTTLVLSFCRRAS